MSFVATRRRDPPISTMATRRRDTTVSPWARLFAVLGSRRRLRLLGIPLVLLSSVWILFRPLDLDIERSSSNSHRKGGADRPPPVWSAAYFATLDSGGGNLNQTDEATARLEWRWPGQGSSHRPNMMATELLTSGLGSVLPYYQPILPALRFDPPFTIDTFVDVAVIPGLVDVNIDLHECQVGRTTSNGSVVLDGTYNACVPQGNQTGRDELRALCYEHGKHRGRESRIFGHPNIPGHELWSCNDTAAIEQLAALQVLDYLIGHKDRFYSDRTNNLFFQKGESPVRFLSLDHELPNIDHALSFQPYPAFVKLDMLLDFQLPEALWRDLLRVRTQGTLEGFVARLDAGVRGELDRLVGVYEELFREDRKKHRDQQRKDRGRQKKPENDKPQTHDPLAEVLWRKLESVVDFYSQTNGRTHNTG